jgi:hypothetical protein
MGVQRILMLGGSTMASFGTSPFDSIAGHAQRVLTSERWSGTPEMRYEVINAGVGAYNSAQEYLYLMSELVNYQPDIVVFYDGWNDSRNGHGHFSDAYDAHLRKAKKFQPVPFSSVRLKRHRDLSKLIEQSYGPAGAAVILKDAISRSIRNRWRHTGIRYWGRKYQFRKNWKSFWKSAFSIFKKTKKRSSRIEAIKDDYDPRTLKVYEENIRRSAALSGIHGFKVLFALQPIIGVDGKSYAPGREQNWVNSDIEKAKILRRKLFYNSARLGLAALFDEYADQKNICISDMSRVFKGNKEPLYVDEGHLNSRGNKIVAAAIVNKLADCGFLSPPPATK